MNDPAKHAALAPRPRETGRISVHQSAGTSAPPLWDLRNISKAFPGVQALDNVSLSLVPGEVHALIGENGSGKSTLCKCLAGVYQPDSGVMLYQGQPVRLAHPLEARDFGVAIIYQEFSLVPTLSVVENIFLGRLQQRPNARLLDWEGMRGQTHELLAQLDLDIDPDTMVRDLSVAEKQLVEIAKALAVDSTVLIMDEPTSALGLAETQRLLDLIRRLAARNKAILYISHRLDEVFEVADVVTIFKDGQLVIARQPTRELSLDVVVRHMVGVDIEQHYPKVDNTRGVALLEVENLHTENGVNGVSFTVSAGEVFGLGGMVGSGRTEIARAIFGLDRPTQGTMRLNGRTVQFSSPDEAIRHGVGLVPEDRKADGLFFNFAGPPNITISRLKALVRTLFMSLGREEQVGRDYVARLKITPTALERSVEYLSGGNQQKVVIARWLFSQARLLIFDEPTRGIDVGAKIDVYHVVNELTSQGISILFISSDFPELLAMSDRVAVVRDGRILHVAEGRRLTEYQLTSIASGAEIGSLAYRSLTLRDVALPWLHRLRDETGLTVHLAVLDEREMRVLYLEKLAGTTASEMMSRTGATAPATCTGVGKALLAYEYPEAVQAWIHEHGLPAFTEHTITDPVALKVELDRIREQGYALDQEEHEAGIACVAAPVMDGQGNVLAAVSISGTVDAMPANLGDSELRQAVTKAAGEVSASLAGLTPGA